MRTLAFVVSCLLVGLSGSAHATSRTAAGLRGAGTALLGTAAGAATGIAITSAIGDADCAALGCGNYPLGALGIGGPAGAAVIGPIFPIVFHAAWGDPQVGYVAYITETTALTSAAVGLTPVLVAPDSPVSPALYVTGLVGIFVGTPVAAGLSSARAVGGVQALRITPLGGRTPGFRLSGQF